MFAPFKGKLFNEVRDMGILRKDYLISYAESSDIYHALNSNVLTTYVLNIKSVWLGIFKTYKTVKVEFGFYDNIEKTRNRYDALIKNNIAIN